MRPILALFPSLNRPAALSDSLASFIQNDSGLADYLTLAGDGGSTQALNRVPLELVARYEIIGLMADDVRMRTRAWDKLVCDQLAGRLGLVYGRDGICDSAIPTHRFISSQIIAQVGFLQPPCLFHFYGDNFWRDALQPLGLLRYLPGLFIEHLHICHLNLPEDSTHRMIRKHINSDGNAWRIFQENELPAVIDRIRMLL